MLAPEQVSFLGLEAPTPFEAQIVAQRGIAAVDVEALIADPPAAARAALAALADLDALAVHFDVDVVDFLDAPLAENTNRGRAPSLEATGRALAALLADPRARALTVTEFNPHHGAEDGSSTRRLVDVLVGAAAAQPA
jgi:arginase